MPRIMLFIYSYARQKINNRKNAADSLAISMTMRIRQYGAKRIAQNGRSRPSGNYSPRIASADAMVIDFCVKNRVVALWKSLFEASVQKARNGPSTQLIEVKSCVERSNTAIKAEEHS